MLGAERAGGDDAHYVPSGREASSRRRSGLNSLRCPLLELPAYLDSRQRCEFGRVRKSAFGSKMLHCIFSGSCIPVRFFSAWGLRISSPVSCRAGLFLSRFQQRCLRICSRRPGRRVRVSEAKGEAEQGRMPREKRRELCRNIMGRNIMAEILCRNMQCKEDKLS